MSHYDDEHDDEHDEALAARRDALISAGMDESLSSAERDELDRLLAEDDDLASRARAFQRIDDQLRALAQEPIAETRLSAGFASLRERLALERRGAPEASRQPAENTHAEELRLALRGWRWALGVAAAAAVVAFLILPTDRIGTEGSSPVVGGPDPEVGMPDPTLDLASEEDLALALGYGDEMDELGRISNEDLEVIEQLELLDFLSAREQEERG